MKLFINLARDQLRASAMQEAFAACKHQPARFNAVNWNDLSEKERAHFYPEKFNEAMYFRKLTAGECGCYASHLEIWRQLVESDAPWALIFEDDVEPEMSFDSAIDAIGTVPHQWDIIKLIGRSKEKVVRQKSLTTDLQLVQYSRIPILASAYIVSKSGAQKMLDSRVPFARPIDVDLRWWWENNLRVFGVLPYPVRLAGTSQVSTIGKRNGPRDWHTRLNKVRMAFIYNIQVLTTAPRQSEFWRQLTP